MFNLSPVLSVPDLHILLAGTGLVGAGVYLGSYAAVQLGRLDGNGVTFTVLNTVAALLVLISLIGRFNIAAAVIQISWLVIGLTRLARQALARRPERSSCSI